MQIENFVPIMIQRVFCRRAATLELNDRKLTGMNSPSQCSKPSLDYMGKFFFFYKTSIYVLNCIKFPLRPYRIPLKSCNNYNLNKLSGNNSGFERDELLA